MKFYIIRWNLPPSWCYIFILHTNIFHYSMGHSHLPLTIKFATHESKHQRMQQIAMCLTLAIVVCRLFTSFPMISISPRHCYGEYPIHCTKTSTDYIVILTIFSCTLGLNLTETRFSEPNDVVAEDLCWCRSIDPFSEGHSERKQSLTASPSKSDYSN